MWEALLKGPCRDIVCTYMIKGLGFYCIVRGDLFKGAM